MINENSKIIKVYDALIKWPLYLISLLLPIFFLPWTANVLDFNKQSLLLVLAMISLLAWLVKSLVYGTFRVSLTPFILPLILFIFIYFLAAFFSLYRYGSMWGNSSNIFESFMTVFGFFVFYIAFASNLKRKEMLKATFLFLASLILVFLIGILQLFGRFILPFNFAKNVSFNTVGSVNSFGVFAAILLPFVMSAIYISKKTLKISFISLLVLITIALLLVNFSLAWLVAAVGCALFIVFSMQKRDLIGGNKLVLPMFFLAVSLLFVFFNFQLPNLVSRPIEVYLNQKASLNIALNTLKEKPIFGSGPGTFSYDFSKFKSPDFNKTLLWNVRFEEAGSKILNILAETGIIGFISYIFLLGTFLFYGLLFFLGGRRYLKKSEKKITDAPVMEESGENKFFWMIGVGAFISFASIVFTYFIYNSNMVIDFSCFFLFAIMSVVFYPEKKEIELRTSSIPTLTLTFALMIVFIASLGILISGTQKYTAEIYYFKALNFQNSDNVDAAVSNAEKAFAMNQSSDVLARDLSQIYLSKLNKEIQRKDIPASQVTQNAQRLVQLSVTAVQTATSLNSHDPSNWSVRGYIFQNLIPLYIGFDEEAIKAYDEAIKLEPVNPYYLNQQGIVLLTTISQLKDDQKTEKEKKFADAEEKFNRAIELKSDYAAARFQLAILYQMQGKTDQAIDELKNAEIAAPLDVGLIFQLGLLYYNVGKYTDAQQEFEKAININSQYSNALYFLGLTYDKLGNKNKAIEMVEKVLTLNPDNEDLKKVLDNLKNGRSALYGFSSSTAAPVDENPSGIQPSPSKETVSPSPVPGPKEPTTTTTPAPKK